MKPGSSKQAARGRQEAPAASQRGTLGGTFELNGVPPLAIRPGRPPWQPSGPILAVFLLRTYDFH